MRIYTPYFHSVKEAREKKQMSTEKNAWYQRVPDDQKPVLEALLDCARKRRQPLYLVGGAVRDMMVGLDIEDLDFAVESGALALLDEVRRTLGSGTVIELGDSQNDTARLVCRGLSIDVSGYRNGAMTIEEDLALRDFTINSMAVLLEDLLPGGLFTVIDPLGGRDDLAKSVVRANPGCFDDDPLRMVRAYRFSAQLDFTIAVETIDAMEGKASLLSGIAAERVSSELDTIMATARASTAFQGMRAIGLLEVMIPELFEGNHVQQPPFHHLDVMEHNLLALKCAEWVIADPHRFFPDCDGVDFAAAQKDGGVVDLKWAALLHDIGKPATRVIDEQRGGRITFYNHDECGADLVFSLGQRLRWSNSRVKRVAALVRMHMHPFHLLNVVVQDEELSNRAKLKICKRAGSDLTLLFMLAMADSLAGQGPEKPAGIERRLASLFGDLSAFFETTVQPVIRGPKLLTGHDLIATFGLEPGPWIGDLLQAVEEAAVEGDVTTAREALAWVEQELAKRAR